MTNTIQSVFLSVTHVFVSILKLFLKIWLSKMYPYFKLLIFGYISRSLTKFSTLLGFFLGSEHECAVIFCPRPQEYGQKMIYKEVPRGGPKDKKIEFSKSLCIDTKTWVTLKKTDWIVFVIHSCLLLKKDSSITSEKCWF